MMITPQENPDWIISLTKSDKSEDLGLLVSLTFLPKLL